MRDIKFRGKHKNPYGDKWVHGYYAMKDGRHVIIMPHAEDYIKSLNEPKPIPQISVEHAIDGNTIGQYTGLKNKNGTEIYEGDIIKDDRDEAGVVEWSEEDAKFVVVIDNEIYDLGEIGTYSEVIGNIYDNLEILGE